MIEQLPLQLSGILYVQTPIATQGAPDQDAVRANHRTFGIYNDASAQRTTGMQVTHQTENQGQLSPRCSLITVEQNRNNVNNLLHG
jgi:hypothetical protein